MYYYSLDDTTAASLLPDLPLPHAGAPAETPQRFLVSRDPSDGRALFCVSDPRQLAAETDDLRALDPGRIPGPAPELPEDVLRAIGERRLSAVNVRHPKWREALTFCRPRTGKKRVHILAVGDVGSTLLTALKLAGGDCIGTIGICDLNENTVRRWVAEMSQISAPWDYDAFPEVVAVDLDHLFECDVFVFIATKSIPAVGSGVKDVRMAQFEANRSIVAHYARQARAADYRGLFIVMSDPVDPLCKAAWLASNEDENGVWDGLGLLPEQVHGFGLGVMNARAAALAKQNDAYRSFLTEGRSFGPHGQGLIIANSVAHYDDDVSQALTKEVVEANLRIREMGFKPYVAPAISSGALQLLLLLRGRWHCGSVHLGGVWFGCRNRYTPAGLETEALSLPDGLFARLRETEQILAGII